MENQSKHQERSDLHIEVAQQYSDYKESLKNDEEFSVLKKYMDRIKFLRTLIVKNAKRKNEFPGKEPDISADE